LQEISQLFPVFVVNTGVVKKGRAGLIVVHDCSKVLDGHTEELKNALQNKKEKVSANSVRVLDPATVLSLFRRMTDEVGANFHPSRVLCEEGTVMYGIGYLMCSASAQ
jgi:hypothetical protein